MKPISISLLAIVFTLTATCSLAESKGFKVYPKTAMSVAEDHNSIFYEAMLSHSCDN
jgi:hypothetical protein